MDGEPSRRDRVVPLDACAELPVERIGGKAAALARLRRSGFEVPPGLVLTTDAAREARSQGGVLPAALRGELVRRWREAGWRCVAVRSSGVLEDRADLSLAGQLETVLGVEDERALVAAVERGLASARSPRVRAYLERRLPDVDPDRLLCACLIQPLLDPECAGVAFTVDPGGGGARDRVVIECVRGRGDALVAGRVRPERHVLARPQLEPLSRRCAPGEAAPLLSAGQARRIAELALAIEARFAAPQDVEWALVEGRVSVLQARPVTALGGVARDAEAVRGEELARLYARYGSGPGLWTNFLAAELLPCPTPASLELMRAMGAPGRGGVLLAFERDLGLGRVHHGIVADTICGRAYADVRSVERILADLGLPLRLAPPAGEASWPRLDLGWLRLRWGRLALALPRLLWLAPRVAWRTRALLRDGARRFWQEDLPAIEREVAGGALDLRGLDDAALLRALDAARAWCAGPGRRIWERANQAALLSFGILALRTRRWLGDGDGSLASALVRGAAGNATLELNAAIADLAGLARARGEDSPELAGGLGRLLARYGHRATTELELAEPRWREEPAALRAAVRRLAASEPPREPPAPATAAVLARVRPWRRRALRRTLEAARRCACLRETPKFHYLRRFEQLRALYLEVGRRAVERGGLAEAGDVFHALRAELPVALGGGASAGELAARSAARRARRTLLLGLPPLPTVFRWERLAEIAGAEVDRAPGPQGATLRGDGVSPGRATGRARIVADPADARALGPDAILVAPRTDPGWTPLFLAVRAVVVETGSAVSHASIVAREYGLPMVVNVAGATQRLTEGAAVTVDGAAGWVRLENSAPRDAAP